MKESSKTAGRQLLRDSGPTCSRLIAGVMKWGVWGHQLDTAHINKLIDRCLDLGITTFDHADIYGDYTTEAAFGKALALDASRRDRMELVSKCGIKLVTPNRPEHRIKSYDTSRDYIIACAERSLQNLRTDHLDLLLMHRPSPLMEADEIAEAFRQLRQSGKVLHFGVSNFTPAQFSLLNDRIPLVTNQVEASLQHLDPFHDGTFDQAQQLRFAPMIWSPLGGGEVFGNSTNESAQRIRQTGNRLAEERGIRLDQLLLAWLLQHPARLLPVLGTARPERLSAAVEAQQIALSREEWFMLWEAATGREVP